jgi:double-stranded uracil-DNA glycosylase
MNRTSSPEASTWSSVASIRRRAPQQRAIISQVGAMAFGRCCIAGFTDVPLRAHEERRLLDYGCGITAVVGRPTWRADEVSLEEFKAARAEFKAKIPRYAPRSIAFLGKRALSAMIGQPVLDWGRLPKEFAGTTAWILPNPSGLNRNFTLDGLVAAYTVFRTTLFGEAQARTPLESVSKVPVVNRRQPGTAFGNRQEPFSFGGSNRSICPHGGPPARQGIGSVRWRATFSKPVEPAGHREFCRSAERSRYARDQFVCP